MPSSDRILRPLPLSATPSHKKGGTQQASHRQQVLHADGSVQAEFAGDRRIHSRPHTRQLVTHSLAGKTDNDHKKLGRLLLSIWDKHDKAAPDYAPD